MAPRPAARSLIAATGLALSLLLYCVARYGDAVATSFVLDDFWLLRDAQRIEHSGSLLTIFRPSHAGLTLYRPLTQAGYFYLLRRLFGLDASGYHAVQLLVFGLNSVLALAIARRLTASWVLAAAVATLYAAAPGHAVAVYWVAAFTMSGTALAVFVALLWWLCTDGPRRAAGCGVLQAVALLCSEHATVLPALLGLVGVIGPRRETPAQLARQIAPAAVVTIAYLGVKAWHFAVVGAPSGGYAVQFNAAEWFFNLGRYAAATLNLAVLATPAGPGVMLGAGAAVLLAASAAALLTDRGRAHWRCAALGATMFVVSLLPVLPLARHYYDYFVGVAALGMAIFLVGLCQLLPAGRVCAAVLALAIVATDFRTCDRAAQRNEVLRLVLGAGEASSQLLMSMHATAASVPQGTNLVVGQSPVTDWVIDIGAAQEVFFQPPLRLWVSGGRGPGPPPSDSTPLRLAPPHQLPFWWDPDHDWLRLGFFELHRWYERGASGCD